MAERLKATGLCKSYGPRRVLQALALTLHDGEILALLGPSGAGKSTTLNLIAGLDRPDAGEIVIAGRTVCGPGVWVPPHRRELGMVFQDQLLWPHLTVVEHLDFVLESRGVPRRERTAQIAAQLTAVQLTGRDAAYPAQLSGGERQRLSLARALVGRPKLLLLDEPCAHLDAALKDELLGLLTRLHAETGFSAVYVTHDAAEARQVARRVAVLNGDGALQAGA